MELSLRDMTEGDFPILFEHQLDPVALQMAAFAPRDRDEFTEHWTKILADPAISNKAILVDGHVAGHIVSFVRSKKTEVGYWIGRDYWGRGIASRALSRFLLLETKRPLYAVAAKHNVASIRVLEKCGFAVVGRISGSPEARGPVVEEVILKLGPKGADEVPTDDGRAEL